MTHAFLSQTQAPEPWPADSCWLIFSGFRLLVHTPDEQTAVLPHTPPQQYGFTPLRTHFLGYVPGEPPLPCATAEVSEDTAAPEGMEFIGLRGLYGRLPDDQLWLGGRAVQIIDWDRTHLFCGRCGTLNELAVGERAKRCPQCGLTSYPRLSPAVIVRVTRQGPNGPEILLARGPRHRTGFYSVLAGFVEPGETLESTVHREIQEEVGITVQNVRYFGSQPWPFPNSLMVAFTAEYAAGELQLEEAEIAEARWFRADELPGIPGEMSISRWLIDDFCRNA